MEFPVTRPGARGEEGTAWGDPQQLRMGLGCGAACMARLYCRQKQSRKTVKNYFFLNEQPLIEENGGAAAARGVPVGVEAELFVALLVAICR